MFFCAVLCDDDVMLMVEDRNNLGPEALQQ
jgi:hypothetical protein